MRSYFSGVMREFQEKNAVKSKGYISMKHPVQHFTCRCSQRLLDQYLRRFQCRHKGLADASRVPTFSKLFGLLERNRCGSTWIKILVGILTTSTQMFHSFTVSSGHVEKITPPLQILPFHLEKWDIFKVTCFSNFPMNGVDCVPDPDLRISSLPGGAVTRLMASGWQSQHVAAKGRECDRLDTKAESKGWAAKIAYSHPGIDRKEVSKLKCFLKRLIPLTTMFFRSTPWWV